MIIIAGYCAAFLMGIILGLMGGGGSILTMPVMVYLFSIPAAEAPVHSLFVVGVAAIAGTLRYLKIGKISVKTGLIFGLPSMAAVHLTQYFISPAIPEVLFETSSFKLTKGMGIMLLFSILLLLASWTMIRRKNRQSPEEPGRALRPLSLMIQGTFVGLFTGLVGAGGGFMIVPALVLFAKLPAKEAVGTSLLIIAANSLTGFSSAILAGATVNWGIILPFTGIAIAGILSGVAVSRFIAPGKLKVMFGWFTLFMGIFIVYKTISEGV